MDNQLLETCHIDGSREKLKRRRYDVIEFTPNGSFIHEEPFIMPLPMKTLREAATELGMPEAELRSLVQLNKIRAVMKKGALSFAPDELAKAKRLRRTIPESAVKAPVPEPTAPAPPKPAPPPRRPPPPRKVGP